MENSLINTEIVNNAPSSITSIITDIGAALVFGVGFYCFKSAFKKGGKDEKDMKDKMKPLKEKLEETINKWESQVSL